ncbi:LysR family transcriptional regulator [Thalassomonas viridans]|uniref:LysR family transcriptional regulator n=1 Tax=Thalassomonas viridans TaxID=137584 RepID=A0AAE9Z257_9GAMM|nr:LysR family transcriptional regulator [Thalassomonas viridans]WDE03848.1 LysR family transcriptional regulator [Thalassomonas viridans]
MDQLRALRYFSKVVESGSFTQAAKSFGVPASSLSRRVADLEASLGASLLIRSTRQVKLTEIGRIYFNSIQDILHQLEQSDEAVRSYQATPMGQLRISAMVGFGERILLPLLDEFSELYPKITLDVNLSDELSTLGHDEADIAIRGGIAPNERVVAIKLMENQFIPVASPGYLQQWGEPKTAAELLNHKGLYFNTPRGPTPWLAQIDGQWQNVSAPAVLLSNKGVWLLEKALQGRGILMLPRWVVAPYIATGQLRQLFIKPTLSVTTNKNFAVYLLYQKQEIIVPKVKVAVDFIRDRVQQLYI